MTTRVELAFLLKKPDDKDLFNSELRVEIPIQGQIQFLDTNQMETKSSSPNAVMGVQIEPVGSKQILHFLRRSAVSNLVFPDVLEGNTKFTQISFRILGGQETPFAVSYEIDFDKEHYRVVQGNAVLGHNWLALVTFENGSFHILHEREGDGPGGGDSGDPCGELGCANTNDFAVKIKCLMRGCHTNLL